MSLLMPSGWQIGASLSLTGRRCWLPYQDSVRVHVGESLVCMSMAADLVTRLCPNIHRGKQDLQHFIKVENRHRE